MFLWWGEELIQFYNDAYRPSLGNKGKHPKALGQKAVDSWPEIWDIIYPLIHQVLTTGKATWSKDQLVPIYRNGSIEDVYWTFGYSPVRGDTDKIEGVLVVCQETTEKVKQVKKLIESDQRFRNLIQNATVGIIVLTGEDMVIEVANNFYGQLIDRTVDELLQKKLFTIIPETEAHFRPILDKVRITGEPVYLYDYSYFVFTEGKKKEGFLNLVYQPYKDYDDKNIGVIMLCHDVTEHVKARKKIEESETKLRSIIKAAPAGIGLFVGRDLVVEMPNQTFIEIVGKGKNIEGKPLREVMPELLTEQQPFLKILDDVYTSGKMFQSFGSQVKIVQNGVMTYNYYNITYTPLFDVEGKVYAILDIAVDVTEQVLARRMLEESEKNLRNMILHSPVAMCILSGTDYIVEVANDRMFELWGKQAETLMNKPIFEGLPEAKEQGLEILLQDVFTTGETIKAFERPVDLPRGNKIQTTYLNFVYEPLYDNGVITAIMAVAIEVTEQVLARQKIEEMVTQRTKELAEANEALLRSNEELARSNVNLEEFAYAASHDLKEPVRKIQIFIDRLKGNLNDRIKEDEKHYFDRVERSSKRMSSLIDDLLSYSRVSIRPRTFEQVDLNQLIDLVLSDLDFEIEEMGAMIVVDKLFIIKGHQRQLQQAFHNLIGNALKYCKTGHAPEIIISGNEVIGRDINLHLSSEEQQKKFYEISVRDNGIGFEQEDAERIFNVFTRLFGNSEYKGTGVGLSIVRKVIDNHNGYIVAQSEPGKGSTFKVFLPAE